MFIFILLALTKDYTSPDFCQNYKTNATKAATTPKAKYLLIALLLFIETPEDDMLLVGEGPLDFKLDCTFWVTLGAGPVVYPIK